MLEQAIVDAKNLKEAAIKSAESAVIEKYAAEVKSAVTQILEQEEVPQPQTPEVENSALEDVPMAHMPGEEEEVVVVDLDDIIAAADTEDEDEEEFTLDREEIADEVGIDLDDEESPANRNDDELDLSEDDLVNMFKEMLVVDVPEMIVQQSEAALSQDEKEEDEKVETIRTDGMDEDDIEEYERTMAKNENLMRENKNLKKILNEVKNKLQEINLHNARLLYANRVLSDTSLNEQQKNKIVDMVGNARSVDEAKTIFETLQRAVANVKSNPAQSLSEVITRRSSVVLSGNRREDKSTEASPTYNRWATLAGMTKK
tara:strand:- start:20978 stop:21925 length:948 start_codon:yes stop_codon:yes gene_type:complete